MLLKIVISGASGMVGSVLMDHFRQQGHQVIALKRLPQGGFETDQLEGQDIIIHLAGANISQRWTSQYKKLIESSRVEGTQFLSQALVALKKKPRLLITASAIGFYGNHPSSVIMDEASPGGHGFLAKVCRQWEEATRPAGNAGIRVVNMRLGIVLGKNGGAMAQMMPIFNLGLGGVLGRGDQVMSWVALNEIPWVVEHIIHTESLVGPINVVAPGAVSNREFTSILGEVIKRPVFLLVPAFGIRMLFGEMGQELLLEGVKVAPKRLLASQYVFKYPDLRAALGAFCKS